MKINLSKNASLFKTSIRGQGLRPVFRGQNYELNENEHVFNTFQRHSRSSSLIAFEHPQLDELPVPNVVDVGRVQAEFLESSPLRLQEAIQSVRLKSIDGISCSKWDEQISQNRYDLLYKEH